MQPFEVGKSYRNRAGEYVVQSIAGEQMTIRYVGGGMLVTSISIQARIWENIQLEEEAARDEERQELARQARLEARRRKRRIKAEKAIPKFEGFQESDFQPKKRGIAWAGREQLGKVLAYKLGQRTQGAFGQWIVPRQSAVQVAREKHYDRDSRDTNAAFFVAVNEQGVAYGFRVGKPDGKVKATWPWSALAAVLAEDKKVRSALRSALKTHELSLDVYVEEMSYGQVGEIVVQARGFLWRHETAEQEITRKMNWNDLVDYLQTVAPQKRCDLYLRKHLAPDAALKPGAAISDQIVDVLEALLPVYDASVGA